MKSKIISLYKKNSINHSHVFRKHGKSYLSKKINNKIRKIFNSDCLLLKNKNIQSLLKDELVHLILQKTLVPDPFIEKMLIKLRYEILITSVDTDRNILERYFNFIISLSEQCFLNEYVFVQSKKEIHHVDKLIREMVSKKEIDELKIAILGCYIPLLSNQYIVNKLSDYKSKNVLFNDLIDMQIKEPLEEKKIANSIKSIGKISDSFTKKVRDQYEKYPYPRWRYTNLGSQTDFPNIINNEIKPNKIKINKKFYNPNVLIAGCGTGQHIFRANYLNANILGIDISLASLAYAKRKIKESGLKNIKLLHADILQLKNLNKKFDVIESMGTLHHLEDPLKGIKILIDLLEPHGVLKLGLYAEKARQGIIKAQEFVRKNKFEKSITGIRNFREAVFNEKTDLLLRKVLGVKSFYSTSTVVDLVFHVHERSLTCPEIFKILENLNLEFLGFCDSKVKHFYSKSFPNDKKNTSLTNWNRFEMLNPLKFLGFYNLWIRKKKN